MRAHLFALAIGAILIGITGLATPEAAAQGDDCDSFECLGLLTENDTPVTDAIADPALDVQMAPGDVNQFAVDSDGDGLTDWEELGPWFTDPFNPDTDSDALIDGDEVYVYGTKPFLADTDYDGLNDGEELFVTGTDPLDPASH